MTHLFNHHNPQAIALSDFTCQRSWRELEERVQYLSSYLSKTVAPGEHIALLMSNRIEFYEIVIAAICSGLWITPINHHLKQQEINYIIKDSGACLLLTDNISNKIKTDCTIVSLQEIETELHNTVKKPVNFSNAPGATMMYTSGTTGLPKGVKRSKAETIADYLSNCRNFGKQVGFDGDGPHLVTGPLYHAAPMLLALYDLFNGAALFIMPRWDENKFIEAINTHKIKHSHLVPTTIERLLKLPQTIKQMLNTQHLTVVHHGAAPIDKKTKQQIIDWWGPVLFEYWGATEAGITTLCDSQQWLQHPGTVGKALPQFEVFATDENGHPLPAGQEGTLFARHKTAKQVFEYHNDESKTNESHPDVGTFTLGDVGYVDDKGYVFLTDRKHNMVISGGVNIYPAEIEQVIKQHEAINDVAVFGIPEEEWGEKVVAVIEVEKTHTPSKQLEQDILAFAQTELANYKLPKVIKFIEEMPRNPAGKIPVRYLKELFQ